MKLEVTNLTKHYKGPTGELTVLDGIDLSVSSGDAIAITGPSGTGKSTLLYMLGALEPPSSGTITIDGRNVFSKGSRELAEFRNSQIGFVFQDHCLLPQCTVLENVLLPTLVAPPDDYVARARTLLEKAGLTSRIDHRPAELSGGEKQRVAIARALIRNPGLLVCDEPTGNLDEKTAETIASLLLELHESQKNILIVVTHSLRLAGHFPVRMELANKQLKPVDS